MYMWLSVLTRYRFPLVLLVLSLITHAIWFTYPREVVFDEVHFGKFITAYCCTGERFFDIHPPHAKLVLAGAAWLGGFRGGFAFDHIGEVYPSSVPVWALRLVPLLTGSILPVILYGVARRLGASTWLAFAAGWFTVFDTALVVQTRHILLDGMLLVTTFAALYFFLTAEKASPTHQWLWWVATGASAGFAAGTKFTGLAALGLVGVIWLVYARERGVRWFGRMLLEAFVIIASALTVYLAGWALHFILLPQPGGGDAFHKPYFTETDIIADFMRETVTLHRIMLESNYNLTATHPDASAWWSWPFMQKSVFYWQGPSAVIYFLGNPAVWWGATFLFLISVIVTIIEFGQRRFKNISSPSTKLWIPLVGFIIALAPLMRVPRALFLYHYLTPLLFSLLVGVVWLTRSTAESPPGRWAKRGYRAALLGVFMLYIFFSPLAYGLTLSPAMQQWLFWFPGWR